MPETPKKPSWIVFPQRLYPIDLAALEWLQTKFGTTRAATTRSCIRGTAEKMGFIYNPTQKSE